MQAMEMKVELESNIGIKCRKKAEVIEIHFFLLLRDNAECFFKFLSFVSMRGRKSDGERGVEEKVGMSSIRWEADDSVMFFII